MTTDHSQIKRIITSSDPRHAPNLKAFLRLWMKRRAAFGTPILVNNSDGLSYIGVFNDGDFLGAQLGQVNGNGARTTVWCFPRAGSWKPDETFWDRYEAVGVCAYDEAHNWYPERWETKGKSRRCIYCGRKERLKTERKITTEEVWRVAA